MKINRGAGFGKILPVSECAGDQRWNGSVKVYEFKIL